MDDLATEGSKDGHAKLDVDIDQTRTVTDQAFGSCEKVPHADAETDTGYDFVAVLFVDYIFDGLSAGPSKVIWFDLDQVLYRGLMLLVFSQCSGCP